MPLLPATWAIHEAAFQPLVEDIQKIHAEPLSLTDRVVEDPAAPSYVNDGGVAVVSVSGPLSKNGLRFFGLSLMESMRDTAMAVEAAAEDPMVKAILLRVDSPGGTVDGVEELAGAVASAAGMKPLYAYADGLMASAAYWVACNAREIAAPATAEIGSIGVILTCRDISRALENQGVKYNVITAGKYKSAGHPAEPLTDDMRGYLQDNVNKTYDLFLRAVERGRGVTRDAAMTMADGRLFLAEDALQVGLIDRVCGFETFIADIKETCAMTLEELKAKHGEALAAYRAEVLETERNSLAAAGKEALAAERQRIIAVAGVLFGADAGASLQAMAEAGLTAEQVEKVRGALIPSGSAAAPGKDDGRDNALAVLEKAHKQSVAPLSGEEEKKPDFNALVNACMEKDKCARAKAIRAMAVAHPEEHQAWLNAMQKENV